MKNVKYYDYCRSSTQLMADLFALQFDLSTAIRYAEISKSINTLEPNGIEIKKSLQVASVTSYSRVFAGGMRTNVSKDILARLSSDQLLLHEQILDLRNRCIAHSVDDLEHHTVRIGVFEDASGSLSVEAVNSGISQRIFLADSLLDSLVEIAEVLQDDLMLRHLEERNSVIRNVSTEDLVRLSEQPDLFFCGMPDPDRPKKRMKFQD